jgi:hypothetical protein
MPFIERLISISTLVAVLAACTVRDARYDRSQFRIADSVLPPDTVAPSKGMFPMPPSADPAEICCWAAQNAEIDVRKRIPAARSFTLGLMVPKTAFFQSHTQSVRITFVGRRYEIVVSGIHFGFSVTHLALPARVGNDGTGVREIELRFTHPYLPGGSERYGALLTSAYFER